MPSYFSLTINNLSVGEEGFLVFDTTSGLKLLKEVTAAGNSAIRYYWDITDASPSAEFTNLATTITVNGTLLTVASGTNFSFLAQKEGHPLRIYNGTSYEWCVLNRYISATQIIVNKVITNTGQVSTPTYFPNNSIETIIGKVTREATTIYTIDAYYDLIANKNVQIEYLSALPSISDVANFEGRTVLLSTDGYIYTYRSGTWVIGKSAEVIRSATAPVSPTLGTLWFRTTDSRMFLWNGSQWVQTISGLSGTRSINITTEVGIYNGETVIHTLDNNLYRWNSSTSTWVLVIDGTRIDLSNENHTVSANSDGSSPVLTNANTLISVYSGDTNVTSSWTISASPSAGITGSLTDSAPNKLYTVTGFTTDTGTVTFTATRAGYASRQAVFSLSKSKAGTAGAGTVYQITPTVGAVREVAGVFTPASIQFNATSTTGAAAPVTYSGRFRIYTSTDGVNFTLQSSSTVDESSRSYTVPAGTKFLRGELYLAGGFTSLADTETVPTIKDGTDGSSGSTAIRLDLNNETQSIPVVNGSPVLTYATTNIKIYEGVTDATASWSISASPGTGVTGTLSGNGTSNVSYTVSGFTVDSGTVTFTATKAGFATLTGIFTLSKVYSANFYYVSPSVEAIRKNTSGTFVPASITFSSYLVDGNSTPAAYAGRFIIATSTDGTAFTTQYTSSVNESSKLYTLPAGIVAVRVSLYQAGGTTTLLDTETVLVLSDGLDGTNGTNARGVDLTSTYEVFIYDAITGGSPNPASATITATALNTSGTVYYDFLKNGTSVQNTTSATYSYTPQSAYSAMPDKVEVQIREGSNSNPVLARSQITLAGIKPGINGDNARIAYVVATTTPASTPASVVVSGPSAYPPSGTWYTGLTWTASPSTLTVGQFLYQVDGIYNNSTNQTTWYGPPYLSALRVGELSAITVNTGALSVSNTLTIGTTGKIVSANNSGYNSAGIFLGYDNTAYKFSIGNGTNNLSFDGTNLSIPGQFLATGSVGTTAIATNAITVASISEVDASLGLTTSWQDAATAGITVPSGAEVDIYFSLAVSGSVSSAATTGGSAFVRILRDATEIYSSTTIGSIAAYDGTAEYYVGGVLTLSDFNSPKSTASLASGMDFDSPGAGTYTYKVQVQKDAGVWAVEKRKLKLVLRKR
jgi:hypothetical protein